MEIIPSLVFSEQKTGFALGAGVMARAWVYEEPGTTFCCNAKFLFPISGICDILEFETRNEPFKSQNEFLSDCR